MYTSRAYNESYYQSRRKILEEFSREEENDTMKYIEDIEQLVSSTKTALKSLVSGELDYEALKESILQIEKELTDDCDSLNQEVTKLNNYGKSIERTVSELQSREEYSQHSYLNRLEKIKKELEVKEFKIQNMERLYIDLENIIKENIRIGSEQLLTVDQFSEFVTQNEKLKQELDELEEEKQQSLNEYNCLLRENLNLRSKDESFEVEKIKDALDEFATLGKIHKEAEERINKLQDRFKQINKECSALTQQVRTMTKSLESLNIDNAKLDKEIALINKELHPSKQRLNRSFTETRDDTYSL
jgi:chromosome segregation ATPase